MIVDNFLMLCLYQLQPYTNTNNNQASMRSEAIFSAMSFSLAGIQVSCGMDGEVLKIKVNPSESLKPAQLYLSKMVNEGSGIELTITQASQAYLPNDAALCSNSASSYHQSSIDPKLQEKLTNLENTIKMLEERIMTRSQSRRKLRKNSSSEGRFSVNNGSRSNLAVMPSAAIRQNEETEFTEIIQEEVEQNAKLQLLNDILQEKILEKETLCLEVEKRLAEREDLIRELADKLIIANIEKEDIFNEYEKILQNNVFHRMEESPAKPRSQAYVERGKEHETLTQKVSTQEQRTLQQDNEAMVIQYAQEEDVFTNEGLDSCG